MGIRSLVSPIFFVFLLFLSIKAKRIYTPGFIDGLPLKDHYAIQAVGADSAADCYMHPENYGVNTFYFQQPVDQFDSSNKATWQQQVQWKNTSFKPKDDGDVVFLLLGGEGPIPTTWMCFKNYTWAQLAEQHGAFMFQLEHRYFGNSTPTSDMSVPNLKWLNTEQAMADINAFIPAMNKQFKFNKPKWVAFGGSYPGTVAALLRVVYPNITNGNIASSAPLWAKVDFWEYAEKMEEAIAWESQVNVSNAACYNDTKAAFAYIRQAVYTEAGRNELNTIFNITPFLGTNINNIDFEATYFLANIYFTFEGIIQYTFDDRSESTINRTAGLNVANLCARMVDTKFNYTERIFNVYAWVMAWNGYSSPYPFDNDYNGDMSYFQNTSFLGPEASYRGWSWLTCTEFGWLQTTDNGHGIFGNLIPLSWFFQYCQDMFDQTVTSDFIQNRVAATLQRYGLPSNYNGSNVVLPNGSLDPWSELGCNVSSNATNRFVRTTVGGGHCVDMYPYNKGTFGSVEPDDVANTIQLVKDQVAYYLTLPGPFNSTSTPTSNSTSKRASTSVWISLFLIGFFIYLLN